MVDELYVIVSVDLISSGLFYIEGPSILFFLQDWKNRFSLKPETLVHTDEIFNWPYSYRINDMAVRR